MSTSGRQIYHAQSTTMPLQTSQEAPELQDFSYESDMFRMFVYKIRKCHMVRGHDWTSCPFAHHGEKAQRRHPRQYAALPCRQFKMVGYCTRGDACLFAHGIFEYWLHPSRYRTRQCTAGLNCGRKVCFFAHTPEQLRTPNNHHLVYVYGPMQGQGQLPDGRGASTSGVLVNHAPPKHVQDTEAPDFQWVSELLDEK